MRHHERRGQNLEPEHPLLCCLLDKRCAQIALTLILIRSLDAVQHLNQIRPGAAAGVEHVHVICGQPVVNPKLTTQHPINPFHHVLHYLRRGVPHS